MSPAAGSARSGCTRRRGLRPAPPASSREGTRYSGATSRGPPPTRSANAGVVARDVPRTIDHAFLGFDGRPYTIVLDRSRTEDATAWRTGVDEIPTRVVLVELTLEDEVLKIAIVIRACRTSSSTAGIGPTAGRSLVRSPGSGRRRQVARAEGRRLPSSSLEGEQRRRPEGRDEDVPWPDRDGYRAHGTGDDLVEHLRTGASALEIGLGVVPVMAAEAPVAAAASARGSAPAVVLSRRAASHHRDRRAINHLEFRERERGGGVERLDADDPPSTPPADTTRKRSIAVWTPPNVEAPLTDGTISRRKWARPAGVVRGDELDDPGALARRAWHDDRWRRGWWRPGHESADPPGESGRRQRRRPRRTGVTQRPRRIRS